MSEHHEQLTKVLKQMKQAGLKEEKCEFTKSCLEYFGYTITKDGLQAKNERVKTIL